ncbi:DICT sensory domain-containing protein [Micromonospora halophytica]|uniref:Diguanylate Cyclase and Two-component system sensory domain-containing protein n=1 Tax=Micromonospora halophytica TaxID=47864 RepID=A0A1C5HFS8_9ACTN|nr:DICT sensory domain-containing protein [Micromonospora halophytica]SCG44866.1 Diguanylate Cyclase and Two-component system sensory domain-containing protein [Micromonospora halophytica]
MLHSGPPTQRFTKRSLVTVSHAIEEAALATAEDGPLVVIALFQRMPYFTRELARYRRIAAGAAVTVVGLVGETPPELPAGAYGVALDDVEELAREWSVVALTPRFGATLVARDRREVEAAVTLEAGRLFDGRWGFRRDEALHEVVRLRDRLADRLPATALATVDQVLDRVRHLPATPGESRAEAGLRLMAARAERARRAASATTRDGEPSEVGLVDEPTLRRWTGLDGVTASGTLPVALVGVRVAEPTGTPERFGRRSTARETQAVIGALTAPLRPVDRAVRLAGDEYLLVLPAVTEEEALAVAARVHAELAGLARSFPFVAYAVHAAVTVTDQRPLPVADVRHAVEWAAREQVPVATVAREPVTAGHR